VESVNDYVRRCATTRYAAALDTGANVRAFADGLVRGGYAIDPGYADKLVAIAGQVVERLQLPRMRPECNQFKSRRIADTHARAVKDSSNGDMLGTGLSSLVLAACP
jgi:hypothetical protein